MTLEKSSSIKLPKFWWGLSFGLGLLLAVLIRLPYYSQIPNGLNRDEAALGYNAFSLIKTGRDEFGKAWPVSITSFGDQKLPGYVYSLIPFIAVFGLETWVIRLPSLLAGLALVLELGFLAKILAEKMGWSDKKGFWLTSLVMIFTAVAPWANHFSRLAYEANLALALFILGLITYHLALEALAQKRLFNERFLWLITASCWSITLLTYHSYQIFLPVMVGSLILIDAKKLIKIDKIGLSLGVFIAGLALSLIFFGGILQANLVKSSGINPFKFLTLAGQFASYRQQLGQGDGLAAKILFNKQTELATVLTQNYLTIFSGSFFFVQGSNHGDHNPGHMSNLPLYLAPLILIGLGFLWTHRTKSEVKRIFAWVLLGGLPAALTVSPQHEVRLLAMFPALLLIGAFGAVNFLAEISQKWLRLGLSFGLGGLIFISSLRMCLNYWYIIPAAIVTHEKDQLLATALIKYQATGKHVITNSVSSSPYIWYLVATKFDPALLQKKIERYQPDAEGFIHVKKIDNVYFQTIDWNELTQLANSENLILILPPQDVPIDKKNQANIKYLESLVTQNGQVAFDIYEFGSKPNLPVSKGLK